MKNLMKRLAATAFCLALLPLTGCGDDNTDDPLIPPPSDAPVIEAAMPYRRKAARSRSITK